MRDDPDRLLLLGLASLGGACLSLAPAPAGAVLAVGVALLFRRGMPWIALLALALAGTNALRASELLTTARAAYAALLAAAPTPVACEVSAQLVGAPVAAPSADGRSTTSAAARVLSSGCALPVGAGLRLYGLGATARRGDVVSFEAKVGAVHLFDDEGASDPISRLARTGVVGSATARGPRTTSRSGGAAAQIDRARAAVRARIDATFAPEAAPLARALVLGEAGLDPADDEAFRLSGLSHLLAVSGTHLVLAVATAVRALRALLARTPLAARFDVGRAAALLGVPLAWLYCDFAGGSGSAVRAAAMLSFVFAARAVGRRPDAVRAFGLSLLACSLAAPLSISDPSFALSVGATAGLLGLGPAFERALVRGPSLFRPVLRAAATTLSASAGCAAPLLGIAPGLPLLSVVANLVAAPLGELAALPACLAHAALGWLPHAEALAARLGGGALLVVRAVAHLAARHGPSLALPPPTDAQLAALGLGALAHWLDHKRTGRLALGLALGAVLALELGARLEGAPTGLLRLTVLDVGQGDALIVDLPDGRVLLVDFGGLVGSPVDTGKRVVLPALRARRRSSIDVAVVSHPHPDHFGGLGAVAAVVPIRELWDTGQAEAEGAGSYAALLHGLTARGTRVRKPSSLCDEPLAYEGGEVRVLAPCPDFHPDRGPNDNSFVLRITYRTRSFLLVGDAEREEEEALVARGEPLRADVLKVGHHGSRTSSSRAFVEAVGPALAVVSAGVRNRFGHPHPLTVGTFEALGVPLLRTDRGGEIRVATDGGALWVERGASLRAW